MELGYKVEQYIWNKPDLFGKSHAGGARQATSSEYIIVVYKHANPGASSLANHFSLLDQKYRWCESFVSAVSENFCCQADVGHLS